MERVANDGDIFWQDNENFVEDGIQIEPFNLNKEREEVYFDADGNFVEYVNDNEIKVKHLTYVHSNCIIKQVY
jgi:CD2 antigen cytoplasmic tail-binding protein 2